MDLTPRQAMFCEEYLVDLNATQAAIRAGYAKKTANREGSRLLLNVDIQKKIQELKDKRSNRTQITADRVLQELASIGFARITDVLKVREVERKTIDLELDDPDSDDPITTTLKYKDVQIFNTDDIDPNVIPAIAAIKQGTHGIEIKMHDKVKALENIGEHLGMFTKNIKLSGDAENPITTNVMAGLTFEELYILKYGRKPE
jgi:phage terminase small subunit